jgi:hypothetical protein
MSKVAFVADCHIGNHQVLGGPYEKRMNTRCRETARVLRNALRVAEKRDVDAFVVLGDLFDTADPYPQIEAEVMGILVEYSSCPIYLLVGNHDQWSVRVGDNALAPLRFVSEHVHVVDHSEMIRVAAKGKGGARDAFLLMQPFIAGASAEQVLDAARMVFSLPRTDGAPLYLCAHIGIKNARTPPYLRASQEGVEEEWLRGWLERAGARGCCVGNWHEHYADAGRRIVQCGALCPTGFDNPSPEDVREDRFGTVVLLDTDTGEFDLSVRVPGPRFLTLDHASGWRGIVAAYRKAGHLPYVRLRTQPENVPSVMGELQLAIEEDAVFAGEVVPVVDAHRRSEAAKQATEAYRSRTLISAIDAYIDRVELDPGLDRENVRKKVLKYATDPRKE